jgi:glycosyltransferase involved in cell wall biosynthesis
MRKRILFYAAVPDPALFQVMLFYRTDLRILGELGYEIDTTNRMRSFLRFWAYDVAFIWFWTRGALPGILARLFGKKVICTGGFDDIDPASSLRHRIVKWLYLITTRIAHANVLISPTEIANFERHGFELRNHHVVPCVVDFERYRYDGRPKKNLLTTVCWMGSDLNPVRKGVDRSIRLMTELVARWPDVRLTIICTDGPGHDAMRRCAVASGVENRVSFAVGIPEEEKIELLRDSRFYLQLSTYESFGLAAVEAMAAGAVVVHSGKGALAFTVGASHGLDVGDDDARTIATRLDGLLKRGADTALVRAGIEKAREVFAFDVRKQGLRRVLEMVFHAA